MKWLERERIIIQGELYIDRFWIFRCDLFGLMVHHILRSDQDRELHDHPWDFWSLIIKGSYDEITLKEWTSDELESCRYTWWSLLRRKAKHAHRLELAPFKDTWSLILTFKWRRAWGFYTKNGWVHHRIYEFERMIEEGHYTYRHEHKAEIHARVLCMKSISLQDHFLHFRRLGYLEEIPESKGVPFRPVILAPNMVCEGKIVDEATMEKIKSAKDPVKKS